MVGRQVQTIVSEFCHGLSAIFSQDRIDAILFGSYARGDNDDGADIDVLLLVDTSREEISRRNWQVGDLAAELLLQYGILVSPIVENRDYFNANADILPFYRNIRREGVRLNA